MMPTTYLKRFRALLAATSLALTAMFPVASTAQTSASHMPSKAEVEALTNRLAKLMPGLVIDSIKPSPVPGLWELVSGGDVAYFTADGGYMIQGTMFNVQSRRNISDEALTEQRAKALGTISKDALIAYPAKGKAKHTITVFTDPSCPYCKLLHAEIPKLNEMGITVNYAPYARSGNGTLTNRQLQEVVCASDARATMDGFMQAPQKNASGADCKAAQDLVHLSKVANTVGLKGTPYIVTSSGKALSGYMPAKDLLAALQEN